MSIIVEDGSIVAGANSYIDGAYLAAYGAARGITFTADKDVLISFAAAYVEGLNLKGDKRTKEQPMYYPVLNLSIDGFIINSDEIPKLLKDLQAEVAIAVGDGDDPLATVARAVKKEKVDVIEVEYQDNAAPFVYNLRIKSLERKLVSNPGGSSFGVSRT